MAKEKPRKSILVTESAFNEFAEKRKALGMNSTELLDALLQEEVERTTTLKVEHCGDFDNEVKKLTKREDR